MSSGDKMTLFLGFRDGLDLPYDFFPRLHLTTILPICSRLQQCYYTILIIFLNPSLNPLENQTFLRTSEQSLEHLLDSSDLTLRHKCSNICMAHQLVCLELGVVYIVCNFYFALGAKDRISLLVIAQNPFISLVKKGGHL